MSEVPTASIAVAPETLTVSWLVTGSIVVELLVLIVFLVRAAWWLSGRFTSIDTSFTATAKEITQLKSDVSNDIAGRRAVVEARDAERQAFMTKPSERAAPERRANAR